MRDTSGRYNDQLNFAAIANHLQGTKNEIANLAGLVRVTVRKLVTYDKYLRTTYK